MLEETNRTYDEAVDNGWGKEDFSAVTHVVEKRIGRKLSLYCDQLLDVRRGSRSVTPLARRCRLRREIHFGLLFLRGHDLPAFSLKECDCGHGPSARI